MNQRLSAANSFAIAMSADPSAAATVSEPVSAWSAWVMAFRPKTLTLSVTPVVAAVFWAWLDTAGVRGIEALFSLIGALAIQIGTNLWNDACDGERGADRADRLGPPRVTALGLLPAQAVRRMALAAFVAAAIAGIVLLAAGGWPILIVGVASLLCGLAYSSGPWPISASPFGEIFVLVFFGLVAVGGTYYLQTGTLTEPVLMLGATIGLPSAAVLLVNNHRDRVSDARAGRRTLAILAGVPAARVLYAGLMLAMVAGAVLLVRPACWQAGLVFVPIAAIVALLVRDMARTPVSRGLNRTLARTALSQFALFLTIAAAMLLCPA